MHKTEGCTVVSLSVSRLEQEADNPALAALLRDGWQTIAYVVVQDPAKENGPSLMLLLRPPVPVAPPVVVAQPSGVVMPAWTLALLLTLAGSIVAGCLAGWAVSQ